MLAQVEKDRRIGAAKSIQLRWKVKKLNREAAKALEAQMSAWAEAGFLQKTALRIQRRWRFRLTSLRIDSMDLDVVAKITPSSLRQRRQQRSLGVVVEDEKFDTNAAQQEHEKEAVARKIMERKAAEAKATEMDPTWLTDTRNSAKITSGLSKTNYAYLSQLADRVLRLERENMLNFLSDTDPGPPSLIPTRDMNQSRDEEVLSRPKGIYSQSRALHGTPTTIAATTVTDQLRRSRVKLLASLREQGKGTESDLWTERPQHASDSRSFQKPVVQGRSLDASCRTIMVPTTEIDELYEHGMPISSAEPVMRTLSASSEHTSLRFSTTRVSRTRLDPLAFSSIPIWSQNQHDDVATSAAKSLLSSSQPIKFPDNRNQSAETMALLSRNTRKLKHLERLSVGGDDLNADHVVEVLAQIYPSPLTTGEEELMKTKALLESNNSKLHRLEDLEKSLTSAEDGGVSMMKDIVSRASPAWLENVAPLPATTAWLRRSGC